MNPGPGGSLRLVADSVLVRNIQKLRRTQSAMRQNGIEEDPNLREVEESLRQMEAEAERRGLSVPEVPAEG